VAPQPDDARNAPETVGVETDPAADDDDGNSPARGYPADGLAGLG
jgi:hypothetical protein